MNDSTQMSQNLTLPPRSTPKVLSTLGPSEPPWFAATRQLSPRLPLASVLLDPSDKRGPCLVPSPAAVSVFYGVIQKGTLWDSPLSSQSSPPMLDPLQSAIQEGLYLAYSSHSINARYCQYEQFRKCHTLL